MLTCDLKQLFDKLILKYSIENKTDCLRFPTRRLQKQTEYIVYVTLTISRSTHHCQVITARICIVIGSRCLCRPHRPYIKSRGKYEGEVFDDASVTQNDKYEKRRTSVRTIAFVVRIA